MFKELINKISKDTFLALSLNTVNYLSSFVLAILVSRYLGLESFGEYSLIFAFVLLLGIVCDFGLSTLLIRKIGENKFNAGDKIRDFNLIKLSISIIVMAVLIPSIYIFSGNMLSAAFITGAVLILPRSLMSTYEASMRSFDNQKLPVIIKSGNSFLQLTVSYFLLKEGLGLKVIMLCILLLDILTLIILIAANKTIIDKYISDKEVFVKQNTESGTKGKFILILRESSVFFLNNFLMLSIKGLNVILLGYLSTAASVGIYSAGSKFINGAGLLSGALFNSFYPVVSNLKNNLTARTELTKKFMFYSFITGLIITIPVFILSDYLIGLTFKTPESAIVLKILSFTIIPVLVYTVTQSYLFSVYDEKFLSVILITAWSINIILSIILIRFYDYTGCAIALTITEIFLMLTQSYKFNYDIRKRGLKKITIIK